MNIKKEIHPAFDELGNFYEDYVFAAIAGQLEADNEKDPGFMADVACVALNKLPAKYIRHHVDMTFYMTPAEGIIILLGMYVGAIMMTSAVIGLIAEQLRWMSPYSDLTSIKDVDESHLDNITAGGPTLDGAESWGVRGKLFSLSHSKKPLGLSNR